MKREIKFRAWIYGLGKMTPVKEIDFDGYMSSSDGGEHLINLNNVTEIVSEEVEE